MTARVAAHPVDIEALVRRELEPRVRYTRRFCRSHDEAEDACQRAVELLVRHDRRIAEEWALAWLRTVAKHEAFAIARARRRAEPVEAELLDRVQRHDGANVEDLCERIDLRERARRALPRLKPQERRALGLLAAGHSYREICAITGWTYTKVNRCIREGRAALRSADARDHAEAAPARAA